MRKYAKCGDPQVPQALAKMIMMITCDKVHNITQPFPVIWALHGP